MLFVVATRAVAAGEEARKRSEAGELLLRASFGLGPCRPPLLTPLLCPCALLSNPTKEFSGPSSLPPCVFSVVCLPILPSSSFPTQLCVSYLHAMSDFADRDRKLRAWNSSEGFTCTCARCVLLRQRPDVAKLEKEARWCLRRCCDGCGGVEAGAALRDGPV